MKSLQQYITERHYDFVITKKNLSEYTSKDGMNDEVKPWYHKKYKTDTLWKDIDDEITFSGVLSGMLNGEDAYDLIGAPDSIVRERVFSELAKKCDVPYDEIYYHWLG